MADDQQEEKDKRHSDHSPTDKLIQALQQQTAALNSFTIAIMEHTQAVSELIAMGSEEEATPSTYLDGSEIQA